MRLRLLRRIETLLSGVRVRESEPRLYQLDGGGGAGMAAGGSGAVLPLPVAPSNTRPLSWRCFPAQSGLHKWRDLLGACRRPLVIPIESRTGPH